MKKLNYLITLFAAAALLLGSCAKEMENPSDGRVKVSVGASIELPEGDTKSQLTDQGAFSWSASDRIELRTGSGFSQLDLTTGAGTTQATFTGWIVGSVGNVAVFPSFDDSYPSISGNTLTVNLPSEVKWVSGEANNWQVGISETSSFQFNNIAALFKVTLRNLPAASRKVTFKTGKRITGAFTLDITETKPYIVPGDTSTDGVTFTFTQSELNTEEMVFYVPVPVGTYNSFAFDVKDADGEVLTSFKGRSTQTLTRGLLRIMPTLTLATINGGGEDGVLKITVPTNYTQNEGIFNLPNSSRDMEVHVEANPTNDITITYYDGENPESHPSNVYLLIEGDVKSLTINLPDSHVELNGTTTDNTFTINNVTSTTSISTLVIGNTNANIKIGKDDDANTGLTVKGGSLQLQSVPVQKLVVDILDDHKNTTEERVNISISSPIKNLEVTNAATQELPDKVFVTLEEGSRVETAINVPEVNCNLYIAPGAQAATVTTSASENTIAGAVETLTAQPKQGQQEEETSTVNVTVTGNVDALAATGEGTTVVVEEGATVSTSISSTDKAVVVVVVDQNTEAVATVPTSQTTTDGGAIVESSGQVVAMIGNTTYSSLEKAFAAVTTTDATTITLMSDVTITENNIVVGGTHGASASVTATVSPVNITFDLNNHNITGTKTIYLVGGSLNITGTGTIETTNEGVAAVGVRYVKSTGGLDYTSKRTLTIGQNVTLKGAKYGLNVFGTNEGTVANNIEVNVNGTIKGDLFVLGNLSNQSNTIDINVNGTIDASAVDMNGIALNGYANVTVGENAVVKGNTGIEVRAGRLVVNGGEITATSEFSIASNGSGTSTKGAAVAVSQHTTNLLCSAIISGGTFTGAYALYEKDVEIAPSDNITLSVTDGTFNGNIYSEDFTHFISGGIFSVDPSAFVADGFEAVEGANGYTIQSAGVARIGSDVYASLAAAVEAVPENGQPTTITMLANDAVVSGITIGANKNIVLELNGKTVSGNTDSQTTYALITNNGTLTIQDNTDTQKDGTGTGLLTTYISNADQQDVPGYASNTITNYGTLTVKSGKIVNNGDGYACFAIDNQTNGTSYSPVLTIDGGRMQQMNGYTYAVRMFCNSTTNFNTVTVNGGVIEGGYGLWLQTPNTDANKANLTINGGILNARDGAALYVGGTKADNSNVSIEIKGDATINGTGAIIQGPLSGTYGSVSISGNVEIYNVQCGANVEHFIYGGTYAVEPNSTYIANGYAATQSGNVYTVGPKTYTCNVYTPNTNINNDLVVLRVRENENTNVNFGSFNNVQAGQVIELTEDVYYNGTVSIPAGVTLDFKGHKLTANAITCVGNGKVVLQNTLPKDEIDAFMDLSLDTESTPDVSGFEIRGGTYKFNPQNYTPGTVGVVVTNDKKPEQVTVDIPEGKYIVPSVPEALVYYASPVVLAEEVQDNVSYAQALTEEMIFLGAFNENFALVNTSANVPGIQDAFVFQMNSEENWATSMAYDGWICDYVVSIKDEGGIDGTVESPVLGLWGKYETMNFGFGIGFNMQQNQKFPLISSVSDALIWDYSTIKERVSTFICGTLPFSQELAGKTLYVDLCLFPAEGYTASKVHSGEITNYIVVRRFEYTFGPTGTTENITDTEDEDE